MADELDAIKPKSKGMLAVYIIGGVVVAFIIWHYRSSFSGMLGGSAAPAPAQATGVDTLTNASAQGAPPQYSSNADWEGAAVTDASALNTAPLTLEQALDTYLNGGTLSQNQSSLVNSAIAEFGAAPQGPNGPVTIASNPAPTVKPTGPKYGSANPWGSAPVFAVGSAKGSQYLDVNGKPIYLSKAEVANARAAGYGYHVAVVPSIKDIPK